MMHNINVLMYGWEFPPHINGGLGVACYGIANGLLEHPVKLTMVLPHRDMKSDQSASNSEFNIQNVAFSSSAIESPLLSYPDAHLYFNHHQRLNISANYRLMQEVLEYAEKAGNKAFDIEHDIIHAHDWLSALAGVKAKKISGKPLVIHIHALEIDRSGDFYNADIYHIEKYTLHEADKIIAVSHYTKKMICQHYGIPEEKITVVHNGLFLEQIKEPNHLSRQNRVLFLGRVTHQKGPFYFLQAAEKLISICPDVEFIIAGCGDQWRDSINHVARNKLSNRIYFTGFFDHQKLTNIFNLAKVYVMPSVSEPFGLTCLEAIANNVPIIVSKQSGIREIFPNILAVDYWDTDKLANTIHALLSYPILSKMQLDQARKILPEMTWSRAGKKIHHLYKELVGF